MGQRSGRFSASVVSSVQPPISPFASSFGAGTCRSVRWPPQDSLQLPTSSRQKGSASAPRCSQSEQLCIRSETIPDLERQFRSSRLPHYAARDNPSHSAGTPTHQHPSAASFPSSSFECWSAVRTSAKLSTPVAAKPRCVAKAARFFPPFAHWQPGYETCLNNLFTTRKNVDARGVAAQPIFAAGRPSLRLRLPKRRNKNAAHLSAGS